MTEGAATGTIAPADAGGRERARPSLPLSLTLSSAIAIALVLLGAALRIRFYTANLSLWYDEASLALDVLHESLRTMVRTPLHFVQAAPPGFLAAEKASVGLFGDSEYSLRAAPLVAGLASLPLYFLMARRVLGPLAMVIAVGLFALSRELVYAPAEVKQYSFDVAVAVGLLYLATRVEGDLPTRREAVVLGVAGAAGVWLSHPAVFYLAGFAVVFGGSVLKRRDWAGGRRLVLPFALWLASFVLLYALTQSSIKRQQGLFHVGGGYLSLFSRPSEIVDTAKNVVRYGFSAAAAVPAAILFVVGVVALWRRNRRRCLLLLTPLVAVVGAALLHQYPLGGRFTLFYVPAIFVVVAAAIEAIVLLGRDLLQRHVASSAARVAVAGAAALVTLAIVAYAGATTVSKFRHPSARDQIKPTLEYMQSRWQRGDTLLVVPEAEPALRYYAECKDCGVARRTGAAQELWSHVRAPSKAEESAGEILVPGAPSVLIADRRCSPFPDCQLPQAAGRRRVWLLFSHVADNAGWKQAMLDAFGQRYTRAGFLRRRSAEVDLFVRKPA